MVAWLSPRRFRTRLLVPIVGLLTAVQVATYLVVSRATRESALAEINEKLSRGARNFQSIDRRRTESLQFAAHLMAGDYAMRQLFLIDPFSPATARSALSSYQERIAAPVIVLLSPEGELLADTRGPTTDPSRAPFEVLRRAADQAEHQDASGYGFLDGDLFQMVMVPLLAPAPEIVAWVGIGFRLDETTARELEAQTDLAVTFVADHAPRRVLGSTLAPALAEELGQKLPPADIRGSTTLTLRGEPYVSIRRPLRTTTGEIVWVVLQRSLNAELAAARALEVIVVSMTVAGLAVAALAAIALARNISQPVQKLAGHTRRVSSGDYSARLELARRDELGELATAFNQMTAGLAERDRVRDLLDKNVSPEVAAQLLRDGAALGGEEREVTVLFCDLRGFSRLSEELAPRELVTLLNRYLDSMSEAIETHGGVVDKYIGDAVMALFGAPIPTFDHADRALRAALAMRTALAALNVQLSTEGTRPLAFGVGINTAHVVAGNMGSHRRLNYSVVGDGVNLASRLQSLTRDPAYDADIIVSAVTLASSRGGYRTRPLGDVTVKGKSNAVAVHALDSAPA